MMRKTITWPATGLCLLATSAATGQQAGIEEETPAMARAEAQPGPELEFIFTPGVWLPRLKGDTTFGSLAGARVIDLDEMLELDDSEPIFRGELTLRIDDYWQVRADGFDFSADSAGTFFFNRRFGDVILEPGDRYRASIDLTSAAIEAGADLFTVVGDAAPERPGREADLRFTPRLGLRYAGVDQSLQRLGGEREELSGDWLALYGGLEMRLRYEPAGGVAGLPFARAMQLEAGGTIGPAFGGDGGFIWQIRAGATVEFTPNVGLTFGYRLTELDVEDGDWAFDAGLQGLFLAATVRF
ncbi:MAG: hypothetical protein SYC29_15810 [Planctomycetota bacterium]|nr:hypothetical protein [Planctomycetota bacterium]